MDHDKGIRVDGVDQVFHPGQLVAADYHIENLFVRSGVAASTFEQGDASPHLTIDLFGNVDSGAGDDRGGFGGVHSLHYKIDHPRSDKNSDYGIHRFFATDEEGRSDDHQQIKQKHRSPDAPTEIFIA